MQLIENANANDVILVEKIDRLKYLNPRARDGGERSKVSNATINRVSIHAPVMDANNAKAGVNDLICFNPRARDGREVVQSQSF